MSVAFDGTRIKDEPTDNSPENNPNPNPKLYYVAHIEPVSVKVERDPDAPHDSTDNLTGKIVLKLPIQVSVHEHPPPANSTNLIDVSTQFLSNGIFPATQLLNCENLPTQSLTRENLPTQSLTRENLPTQYLTPENLPTQSLTHENLPTQSLTRENLPTQSLFHENVSTALSTNENLPTVLSTNQNLPAVLSRNQNLPAVLSRNQNLPVVLSRNQNLPAALSTHESIPTQIRSQGNLPLDVSTNKNILVSRHGKIPQHSTNLHSKMMPDESNDEKFYCDECDNWFLRYINLRRHKSLMHNEESVFLCDHCGLRFKTAKNLQFHKMLHRKNVQLSKLPSNQCYRCGLTFKLSQDLHYHKLVVHHIELQMGQFHCNKCVNVFIGQVEYANHYATAHFGKDMDIEWSNTNQEGEMLNINPEVKLSNTNRVGQLYNTNRVGKLPNIIRFSKSSNTNPEVEASNSNPEVEAFNTDVEVEAFNTNPEVEAFNTNPEVEAFNTNPEVEAFNTNAQVEAFITNPQVEAFITNPQVEAFITNPEVEAFNTNPEVEAFITNPQVEAFNTNELQVEVPIKQEFDEFNIIEEKPVQCGQCPLIFESELLLTNHIVEQHYLKIQTVLTLSTKEIPEPETNVSSDNNQEKELARCPICNKQCKTPRYLKQHMVVHEPKDASFICNQCDYTTKFQTHLIDHQMVHFSDVLKPLKCGYCCKTFTKMTIMKNHMKIWHLEETIKKRKKKKKGFKCQQCRAKFRRKSQLKYHQSNFHSNNVYHCYRCEFQFNSKLHLKYHKMRVHCDRSGINEKPHVCVKCLQAFSSILKLQKHREKSHRKIRLHVKNKKKTPRTRQSEETLIITIQDEPETSLVPDSETLDKTGNLPKNKLRQLLSTHKIKPCKVLLERISKEHLQILMASKFPRLGVFQNLKPCVVRLKRLSKNYIMKALRPKFKVRQTRQEVCLE